MASVNIEGINKSKALVKCDKRIHLFCTSQSNVVSVTRIEVVSSHQINCNGINRQIEMNGKTHD